MPKLKTKNIAKLGLISALYVVLSLILFPFASSNIQVRVGECLTLLPLIFPETVISLFVGCILINVITGCGIFDIIFGSLITLVAGVMTAIIGKVIKKAFLSIVVGGIFPILLNAFLLPLIWYFTYGKLEYIYILQALFLLAGQSISVYGIGSIVFIPMKKLVKQEKLFKI